MKAEEEPPPGIPLNQQQPQHHHHQQQHSTVVVKDEEEEDCLFGGEDLLTHEFRESDFCGKLQIGEVQVSYCVLRPYYTDDRLLCGGT